MPSKQSTNTVPTPCSSRTDVLPTPRCSSTSRGVDGGGGGGDGGGGACVHVRTLRCSTALTVAARPRLVSLAPQSCRHLVHVHAVSTMCERERERERERGEQFNSQAICFLVCSRSSEKIALTVDCALPLTPHLCCSTSQPLYKCVRMGSRSSI